MPGYMPPAGYGSYPACGEYGQQAFPSTAGGTITGGQLLEASANDTVIASGGAARPVGVAGNDATVGQPVSVLPMSQVVHQTPVTGAVVIAAGDPVKAAAAGAVDHGTLATLAAAGTLLGVCVRGATGPAACRWIGI